MLLAFVVLVVWEQFNDAKANVENESSVAMVLYKNVTTYPDEAASRAMKEGLLKYVHQAVEEQHPMSAEQSARGSAAALNQLLALLDGVVPDSAHEQILYTQILQNLNELSKYRNLRHQATHEELPSVVWIGVLAGAIITIGFTFLFGTENFWAHIVMMSLLAALIAIVIYVVIEMDHPTRGSVTIGFPEGYSRILEMAEEMCIRDSSRRAASCFASSRRTAACRALSMRSASRRAASARAISSSSICRRAARS